MKEKYYTTIWVDCEWCITRKFSEEEILRAIWYELSDETFDEIISDIQSKFDLDEFYLKDEDFYKIARIEWEDGIELAVRELGKCTATDNCVPINIYFRIDFDKVKTLI